MSHFGKNVIARERSDRSNLLSQHNEIASPPSAARNDKCDIVEVGSEPFDGLRINSAESRIEAKRKCLSNPARLVSIRLRLLNLRSLTYRLKTE